MLLGPSREAGGGRGLARPLSPRKGHLLVPSTSSWTLGHPAPRPSPTPGCQSPSRRTRPEPAEQWQTARWGDGAPRSGRPPPTRPSSRPLLQARAAGHFWARACELPGCFARSPCRGLSGRELRLAPQGPEAELFPHTNPGQGRGRGVGGNQVNSPHTQCGVRTQSCPTRDAVWDFEQGEGLAVNGHTCGVQ